MTFRSPGVAGDVALLAVLLPIATAAIAFLLLFPIVMAATALGIDLPERPALGAALVIASALVALLVRKKLFWTITLRDADVVLGPIWPRRIQYDRIRFIVAGSLANPMVVVGLRKPDTVPLAFWQGPLRTERIFLRRADADACLRALHQRAECASAIDFDGRVLPPKRGTPLRFTAFKLAETLILRAAVAFGAIALALAGLVVLSGAQNAAAASPVEAARNTVRRIAAVRSAWMIVAVMPALAGYGVHALRRARAVLGGRVDQADV